MIFQDEQMCLQLLSSAFRQDMLQVCRKDCRNSSSLILGSKLSQTQYGKKVLLKMRERNSLGNSKSIPSFLQDVLGCRNTMGHHLQQGLTQSYRLIHLINNVCNYVNGS
ncbi:uncharacterized protein [Nicotiana sylvestris]|uniref:uncharacterized protein isoform X2 n=1 Tax=Nicotiana sylvestris TaxID=4096 RepID=UPI00388CE022